MGCSGAVVRRDDAVVVVVDVQERLAAVMSRRGDVESAAGLLVRAAGVLGVPVIVTRQYPKGLGETVPALLAAVEDAREAGAAVTEVDKVDFCCGGEPAFVEVLRATGRRQVLVTGMETHICVTQTTLALLDGGHEVFVHADACCSRRDVDHDTALARMREAGAAVTTVEASIYEALGRAGTPEFKAVLTLVK